ncbi:MAG: hypothetical protein QOE58_3527 [Actinomycetota bacterium]|jgi:phosphinothricin acetyltransferase|nr:hypothetical protein [Actinomycetota bacterium]
MSQVTVRPSESSDLVAVAGIYAHAVRTSTATLDFKPPPMRYWQNKLKDANHFLVANTDDGKVIGYAYSEAFRRRDAYSTTRETSIYVSPDSAGQGVGAQLYGDLLNLLREDGIHLAVAAVAQPNPASNALHRSVGFTEVGTLDEVAFKFGAYISTTWFQRRLA